MKAFLDPNKTLHTCDEKSCNGCNVQKSIYCHFDGKKLFRFLIFAFPCLIIAGIGICRFNYLFIFPWIAFFLMYFGFIEIRVMCSHCPHYSEPGTKTLQGWANYGSPKIWRYRPGPMNVIEKIVFFAGIAIIGLYPIVIMAISGQFILLAAFVLYLFAGCFILRNCMCIKCVNFACPFNSVPPETRDNFMKHNPVVRDAWASKLNIKK